ncbi:unnamed protein product, partial [marine sediment metagenome]
AVNLDNKLGITLIGFARGRRINIYTNDWRVNVSGCQTSTFNKSSADMQTAKQ